MRLSAAAVTLAWAFTAYTAVNAQPGEKAQILPYAVEGDAVPAPLGGRTGNAEHGKEIVLDRTRGNCVICHAFPVPGEPFPGELGPSMNGIGAKLSEGQIRLRLIDQSRINPKTIMPPYYRVENLTNVAPEYRGRPVLDAQEIEDVVAWLATLKD